MRQISLIENPNRNRGRNEIDVIEEIRNHRNKILHQLINVAALKEYMFLHFRIKDISEAHLEQLKRVVISMIMSPLEINRYCRLIKFFCHQRSTTFTDSSELLIHEDIEEAIRQHL
jgi:hypothetical protein